MFEVRTYNKYEQIAVREFETLDDLHEYIESMWDSMTYPERRQSHWVCRESDNIFAIAAGVTQFRILRVS